jgi:hypothetical protein
VANAAVALTGAVAEKPLTASHRHDNTAVARIAGARASEHKVRIATAVERTSHSCRVRVARGLQQATKRFSQLGAQYSSLSPSLSISCVNHTDTDTNTNTDTDADTNTNTDTDADTRTQKRIHVIENRSTPEESLVRQGMPRTGAATDKAKRVAGDADIANKTSIARAVAED